MATGEFLKVCSSWFGRGDVREISLVQKIYKSLNSCSVIVATMGDRGHLDLNSAKLLAYALVSNRLDYCNTPLSGIADTDLTELQRISNRQAHVVTKSPPFTRSVPLLHSLHWLPVKHRVHFKICLLTCKAPHAEHLVFLYSLLPTSLPSRSLRSNKGITLLVPRIKTNACSVAFRSWTPSLWSSLLLFVRSTTSVATFRRRVKTYVFDLAFPL